MRRMTAGRAIAWIVIAVLALLIVVTVGYTLMPEPTDPLGGIPSSAALVVENRTNTQLALTSDLRIQPCGEATFTRDEVLEAHQGQRITAFLGPDEVGAGLAPLSIPDDVAQHAANGSPVFAVVTAAGSHFSTGGFDRSSLPACAGTAPAN